MISITLPSLYPEALSGALANLAETTRTPYEVIIVSPFEPQRGTAWVADDAMRGCAYAHAAAAKVAHGDYLVPFADDHRFVPGWDEVAVEEFEYRSRDVTHSGAPFALGLRGHHSNHVGTNFGIYYPYFPMMRREHVEKVGWIGGDYQHGFGDSDLAMRVWDAGGRCEWSEAGLLFPSPDDKRKGSDEGHRAEAAYTDKDLQTFLDRWAPKYGKGWTCQPGIDQFNVDLRPEHNGHLCEGNTIYANQPDFMSRVVRMS